MIPALYRGRFAPSPTGPLHAGSLSTALYSFIDARQHHGQWLLRFDDNDRRRCRPGYCHAILQTLELHGLEWDGAVYHQSHQAEGYYEAYLASLASRNMIYRCICSRALLARNGEMLRYGGACANRAESSKHGMSFGWRIRISGTGKDTSVSFHDRFQGNCQTVLADECGDFLVWSREGYPAYPLSTIVDDAAMGITHVIRGVDLLPHTARQIFMLDIMGMPGKSFGHLPVLVDAMGAKLSKQTGAQEVDTSNPAGNLCRILTLGGFKPPADLCKAPVRTILQWACDYVDLARLGGRHAISVAPPA
ncbi:MAG: hypothetical protein RIQ52_491 [Pseudomonadota bacterium]